MTQDEIQELIEKSQISDFVEDENLKSRLFEYLLSLPSGASFRNESFIFRIPASLSDEFVYNYVFNLRRGHLVKASNEIIVRKVWENINYNLSKDGYRITNSEDLSKVPPKEELTELRNMIETLQDNVDKLKKENRVIKDLIYSKSNEFGDAEITQTIPIDIYLDTNEPQQIFEVYDSVIKFAKSLGFDQALEFEAVKGSWFKRMIAVSREKLTSQEVVDRLKEVEYGIEVNAILKQQSEIDKNQSEALSNIIISLKDVSNAAIRVGALIVVKVTDDQGSVSLQTRTLTIKELHLLNRKPELLQMPKQILQALAKEIDDESCEISKN